MGRLGRGCCRRRRANGAGRANVSTKASPGMGDTSPKRTERDSDAQLLPQEYSSLRMNAVSSVSGESVQTREFLYTRSGTSFTGERATDSEGGLTQSREPSYGSSRPPIFASRIRFRRPSRQRRSAGALQDGRRAGSRRKRSDHRGAARDSRVFARGGPNRITQEHPRAFRVCSSCSRLCS